jgi:hypothetical protein
MEGIIDESISTDISIKLGEIGSSVGNVIFEGTGRNGGLEIVGNISELQPH